MDRYTIKTKKWLEKRFREVDKEGIYFAHQPIYGFRKGHCEGGSVERYIRTYEILKALTRLKFKSFLDVGGAEGYKAYLIKRIFNAQVVTSDLSEEACKRAKQIYKIKSVAADICNLPFKNNQFDIVLCSETLEHVINYKKAVNELLRVAKNGLVITLPHEPEQLVKQNIKKNVPHGHIHHFNTGSFDFLKDKGYFVISKKIFNDLLWIPSLFVESQSVDTSKKRGYKKILFELYNLTRPLTKKIFGQKIVELILSADNLLNLILPKYNAILFIIIKDQSYYKYSGRKINPELLFKFNVPFYFLEK